MVKRLLFVIILFLFVNNVYSQNSHSMVKKETSRYLMITEFAVSYGATLVLTKLTLDRNYEASPAILLTPLIFVNSVGGIYNEHGSFWGSFIGDALGYVNFWIVGFKQIGITYSKDVKFRQYLFPLVFPSLYTTIGYNLFKKKITPGSRYSLSVNPVFYYDRYSGQFTGLSAKIRF